MAEHLVWITAKVKPGMTREALRLFREMQPIIKGMTHGLKRVVFLESIEEPGRVGCQCLWASREDFLAAADNREYQRIVSEYFTTPIFSETPTHTAYDVLFESQ